MGRELQQRGHRVTCLQIPDLELKLVSQGLNFYPIGESTYRTGELAETLVNLGKFNGIEALNY